VTTPEAHTDFAQRCAELCAGFVATGSIRRARKSELLPGEVDGAPVIAKRLLRPHAVWEWYFAREVAMHATIDGYPSLTSQHRVP